MRHIAAVELDALRMRVQHGLELVDGDAAEIRDLHVDLGIVGHKRPLVEDALAPEPAGAGRLTFADFAPVAAAVDIKRGAQKHRGRGQRADAAAGLLHIKLLRQDLRRLRGGGKSRQKAEAEDGNQ